MTKASLLLFLLSISAFAQQGPQQTDLDAILKTYQMHGYFVSPPPPAIQPLDLQKQMVIDFYRHFDKFARKLFGCPLNEEFVDLNSCKGVAEEDARELAAIRKLSKAWLDLEDKKKKASGK